MSVQVSCPNCKNLGNVPEDYLGKTIRCKRCSTRFLVEEPVCTSALLPTSFCMEDMPSILVDLPVAVPG